MRRKFVQFDKQKGKNDTCTNYIQMPKRQVGRAVTWPERILQSPLQPQRVQAFVKVRPGIIASAQEA